MKLKQKLKINMKKLSFPASPATTAPIWQNCSLRKDIDSSKPDGTPQKLLDVSRLSQAGWSPSISLEQGIREVYQWYTNQHL